MINRWAVRFLSVLLVAVILLAAAAGVFLLSGNSNLNKRLNGIPNLADGENWYWQDEKTFLADGVAYRPKKGLSTVLCIGLGSSEERVESGYTMGMMPMADTFVLAVVDRIGHSVDLLAIPRDTQAVLDWSKAEFQIPHEEKSHLALQYRYGGTNDAMCSQTTCSTISRLLFDAGIGGYVTIDMDSVVAFADLIGGVAITVPDDPYYCAYTGFTPGQWISMDGPTALQFVQYRDLSVAGSCEMRVERQKVFLDALVSWVKARAKTAPWAIPYCVQKMKPYYHTDLHLNEIAALGVKLIRMNHQSISMHTLPGTVVKGEIYEEYHLDEPGTKQLLLDIFYEPIA